MRLRIVIHEHFEAVSEVKTLRKVVIPERSNRESSLFKSRLEPRLCVCDDLRQGKGQHSPSYISLLTALSFLGISTQISRSICEAISKVRSANYEVKGFVFKFTRLPGDLFCGYERQGGIFMAEPEKAFVDAAYLCSLGRYALDLDAMDFARLSKKRIDYFLKKYPTRTKKLAQNWLEEK